MESAVRGLAEAQARLGHTVTVVAPTRAEPRANWRVGVRWLRLRALGPERLGAWIGIRAALRAADVVHVHGVDPVLFVALGAGRPVVVSTHGGPWHQARGRRAKALALRWALAPALRRARAVCFTSEADRDRFASLGVRGEVVGNGVDLAPLARVVRAPEEGRWLVPGRVDVHKGLDDLLCAIGELPASLRPARLRVVGPEAAPGLIGALRELAGRVAPQLRFEAVGEVDDAAWREELARCALAVFPSRSEGFGIAVVEAQAAGVPVIVSDIPAHRERVSGPRSGVLVDFTAVERGAELARALAVVVAESADVREAAQEHAWDRVVARWDAVYAAVRR